MPTTGSRLGFVTPTGTDPVSELRIAIGTNATLSEKLAPIDSGLLTARPSAGTKDRLWYSTDTQMLSRDTGTAWTDLLPQRKAAITSGTFSTGSPTYVAADTITGLVLPAKGLLMVTYQAAFSSSVAAAGRAAIFLSGNQIGIAALPSPVPQEATTPNSANPAPLSTTPFGLNCDTGGAGFAYSGDLTTGQIVGSYINVGGNFFRGAALPIFAAAGTYTLDVRIRATSGTAQVTNRRLYAEAQAFV